MKRGATWVVVILVLVAVGVGLVRPWWLQRQGRDDLAGCKESLNTLGTAIEAYSTHHGGLYPLDTGGGRGHGFFTTPLRLPQDIVPKYLNEMPTCPQPARTPIPTRRGALIAPACTRSSAEATTTRGPAKARATRSTPPRRD